MARRTFVRIECDMCGRRPSWGCNRRSHDMIPTPRRTALLVPPLLFCMHACMGQVQDNEPESGEVHVALTRVPLGVGCLVIEGTPAGAADPLQKQVTVTPGAATSFSMKGLPAGRVVFEAMA